MKRRSVLALQIGLASQVPGGRLARVCVFCANDKEWYRTKSRPPARHCHCGANTGGAICSPSVQGKVPEAEAVVCLNISIILHAELRDIVYRTPPTPTLCCS